MRNKLFRLATSTIVAGVMAGIVLNAMPQAAMAAERRRRRASTPSTSRTR